MSQRFSEINIYILQVRNEVPADKIHIKVQQDRLLCLTNVDNKKTQILETLELGKFVTRPYLMGVPLMS